MLDISNSFAGGEQTGKKYICIFGILCYNTAVRKKEGPARRAKQTDLEDKRMAYVITAGCVMCGTCAAQCPMDAITQGDSQYEINQDVCVGCGSCAAACPASAIEEQ